jgi:hypothetical protein
MEAGLCAAIFYALLRSLKASVDTPLSGQRCSAEKDFRCDP